MWFWPRQLSLLKHRSLSPFTAPSLLRDGFRSRFHTRLSSLCEIVSILFHWLKSYKYQQVEEVHLCTKTFCKCSLGQHRLTFPRKCGTRVAWLVGKKNPKQIKTIMNERIPVRIAAVATCVSLLDIRKGMRTFSCGELPTQCSRSGAHSGFSDRRASSPGTRKINNKENQTRNQHMLVFLPEGESSRLCFIALLEFAH